jgi:flavin-dependent dehydrogenase
MPFDAIVIGAGPAGSCAAILLSRAGWSVALLEAHAFPRRKVCGECIAASNLALLEALGVGKALRRCAGPELRRVALWCGDERIDAALPACGDGGHAWGRAMAREHLDLLLLEQARALGAAVLQPCRALAIRAAARGAEYEVDAADGGMKLSLRAPVIIRAHGSWQPPPADQTLWSRDRKPSDLLAFKASFRNAALEEGLLPVLGFDGGYGGMVVAGDGLATLACCIRRDRLAASRRGIAAAGGAGAGETVEALLRRECRGVREALAHASRVVPWLAAGPIRPGVRLSHAYRGAFLIGNVAGEVHPIIGEGISMALQSAWLLGEELAASAEAFRPDARGESCRRQIHERYVSSWRAHFRGRMRLAAGLAHAAMRPGMAAPLLPLLRRAPALLGTAARMSGKTRSAVALPAAILSGVIQESST